MSEQTAAIEAARAEAGGPQPADEARRIPTATLLGYGLPSAGLGFMGMLMGVYLLKFATDVLLIAPAAMGVLFGLSRFWDAISDPLVGHLTDRTRSRFGRRRPWMLLGAIPMGLTFVMMWSPPASLDGNMLLLWMGVAILGFYTALTTVDVPYTALGAELSDGHHERTRIFGWKRVLWGLGSLGSVAGIAALGSLPDPRLTGRVVAMVAAGFAVLSVVFAVVRLHERPEFQGRGAEHPLGALRDIWQNPYARVLLAVFLIQQLGVTALAVAVPYLSEYVIGTPDQTFVFLLAMFLGALFGVPLWLRIAPRFEKKDALLWSMVANALIISLVLFVGEGDVVLMVCIAALGGLSSAGTDVLFPSLQADVIDYDEMRTSQRKEGAYFATWAFASKSAGGLAAMLVGLALSAMHFVPNEVQSADVQLGLRALTALLPALLYAVGIALFLRFGLDSREHARILASLKRTRMGDGTGAQ